MSSGIEWCLITRILGKATVAVGNFSGGKGQEALRLLPKVLYVSIGRGGRKLKLFNYLLTILSSFSIYLSDYRTRDLQVLETLIVLSNAITASYRFLTASWAKEKEEHTNPSLVSCLHRRFKTLVIPLREEPGKTVFCADNNKDEGIVNINPNSRASDLQSLVASLGTASLLTAPTRHGNELRIVMAQTLPAIASKAGDSGNIREVVAKLLLILILDTYTWYANHLEAMADTYPAELRRFAPTLKNVEEGPERIRDTYSKLRKTIEEGPRNMGIGEWISKALEAEESLIEEQSSNGEFKKKPSKKNPKVLLGRLNYVRNKLMEISKNRGRFRKVVTVATGQWGLAYPLLFKELLGAEEVLVLYTQNVIEQRLLEEKVRETLREEVEKSELPNVKYVLASATDAMLIRERVKQVINEVLEERDNAIVVSQGVASLAVPLYVSARGKGLEAELF